MKKILIIFLIMTSMAGLFGQTENIENRKYHTSKEQFEKKYVRQEYEKYLKSQIKVEKNKVVIDVVKSIEFSENLDKRFKLIFENGLIDPTKVNGNYVLRISSIDELILLNPNPQTKRFSFWIFPQKGISGSENSVENMLKGRANPDEYYFELQNENADENTSFEKFIEGAKLTYLAYGGVII
ncbi:hypothetical protein [Chryseobacterium sp. ISL-6]|uniref:hypothetical protein n=1 Tax=Chryseobacterium sp. ISL-6 TaxID=2819143 RepID=UPI001BEBAA30|nr:hypothetical protein [Chryseobacterium sp. ISL-6]MBT2619747.1 hypothetical protein [Chryseobacterium sp. ISL-6]